MNKPMTLDDIKGRCVVTEDGHWLWRGAMSEGKFPRVWSPDYTTADGEKKSQNGRRAVWHVINKKAMPNGWRVWSTCNHKDCLAPEHLACGPTAKWGKHMAETGIHKSVRHQMASRKTGLKRAALTAEQIVAVQGSTKTGRALAKELGVTEQTISRARNGRLVCHLPVGGFFSGLVG